MSATTEHLDDIERAMVTIRRSTTRRTLAQRAGMPADSIVAVLDAIEAGEHTPTPATVSSIATALSIDQPRASKLVAAAVDAGFVRRDADQSDGRRALLVRTPAGRKLTDRVHRFRRDAFATAITDWSAKDQREFARLLTRFVDSFTQPAG